MIRLKDCLLAACLVSPLTQAADLGTWGDLWPVREQDMLQLITQRLQSLQSSGQWDQTMDAFKQRVIENSQRPAPVEGIKRAEKYEQRWFDPSIRLTEDLKDNEGRVFARKGDVVNPLKTVPFVQTLYFINVRAFTGKAKFCKKFAAGFSNCCKDSGWGQDVGLARCSSEEKALAKAKKDKLTVSIGEFCSKKVLGICLEKKRSYCQFDSKLAQIVQQQGRNGQLHIGFGGASSPDCRGITVEELQRIDFNMLDFTNFMDDLMKNQKIPENDVLTNKTKERIKEIMSQQSAQ